MLTKGYSPNRDVSSVLTIFTGSFLLFGIQPMLGRTLLPLFGGSAAVWIVCLAAYQILLLVGYGYAHIVARQDARTQRRLHLALMALAVLWSFAFATLRRSLKDSLGGSSLPSLEVLAGVLFIAGLPYVLLSAGSSLVQAWMAQQSGLGGGACGVGDNGAGRNIYKL